MTSIDELAAFYVHTATVRSYLGMGAAGRVLGAPETVPCFARAVSKQVATASGDVIVSTTTVIFAPAYASLFPIDSQVSVNGTDGTVVRLDVATSGALQLPDHVTVYLS